MQNDSLNLVDLNKYEKLPKAHEKINFRIKNYQVYIIRDALHRYSKTLRCPSIMMQTISHVVSNYLTSNRVKYFDEGVDSHINRIWHTHEQYQIMLIHLLELNIWDEHDEDWFNNKIKYFERTKLMYEKPDENGLTKFESMVKSVKESRNFDKRYAHKKKIIDLNREEEVKSK